MDIIYYYSCLPISLFLLVIMELGLPRPTFANSTLLSQASVSDLSPNLSRVWTQVPNEASPNLSRVRSQARSGDGESMSPHSNNSSSLSSQKYRNFTVDFKIKVIEECAS